MRDMLILKDKKFGYSLVMFFSWISKFTKSMWRTILWKCINFLQVVNRQQLKYWIYIFLPRF